MSKWFRIWFKIDQKLTIIEHITDQNCMNIAQKLNKKGPKS